MKRSLLNTLSIMLIGLSITHQVTPSQKCNTQKQTLKTAFATARENTITREYSQKLTKLWDKTRENGGTWPIPGIVPNIATYSAQMDLFLKALNTYQTCLTQAGQEDKDLQLLLKELKTLNIERDLKDAQHIIHNKYYNADLLTYNGLTNDQKERLDTLVRNGMDFWWLASSYLEKNPATEA